MKISFQSDDSLGPDHLEVVIHAVQLTPQVTQLLTALNQLTQHPHTLPITVDDQVILISETTILAIEVFDNTLTVHTDQQDYTTRGTLKGVLSRLDTITFQQISRSTVINLDHLTRLEAEFSGNLLAKLDSGLRFTVSRSYVSALKRQLGL